MTNVNVLPDGAIDTAGANRDVGKVGQQSSVEVQELDWSERLNLALAGALYNFSDEAWAAVRSFTDSELSYDKAIEQERKILDEARKKDPTGALIAEMGGAILPSIFAMLYSGGTATPALVANLQRIAAAGAKTKFGRAGKSIAVGAAEGLVSGTGAAKGDLTDRVTDTGTLISTGMGAVARPLLQGAGTLLKKGAGVIADRNIIRKTLRSLGKAESAELNRIIEETGLSIDDILRRVTEGGTLGDMSDSTRLALRVAYYNAGKGREAVADTVVRRGTEKPAQAMAEIQQGLAPSGAVVGTSPGLLQGGGTGNILKYFGEGIKKLEADESKAYNKIWASGITSEELNSSALKILTQQKKIREYIDELSEAEGLKQFYKINKDTGVLELTRDVDLEVGEVIRRALSDKSNAAYTSSLPNLGKAIGNLEKGLRKILDDVSPDLKNTRAQWAAIRSSADAFDQGSKILKSSADEAQVIFDNIAAKGDDAIAAFRLGYASSLRNKATASNVTTLFRTMKDPTRKEQIILNMIYPGDSLDEAIKKINLADAAIQTRNKVMGQSITAAHQAAERKMGTSSAIVNLVEMIISPIRAPGAAFRLIRDLIGKQTDNLSPDQQTTIAKMLVEEDPDVLRRILRNENLLSGLAKKYNQIADAMISGVSRGVTTTTAADIQRGESPRAIQSIISGMSPKAQELVLKETSRVIPRN
jgi:hypothetical protein